MTGRRGPPSEPTSLKILKGNPAKSDLSIFEPKPQLVEHIEPPNWLGESAKQVWRDESIKLKRLGLLTSIDLEAFARYCDMVDRFHKVVKKLNSRKSFYYPIYAKQSKAEIEAAEKSKEKKSRRVQYLCPYPEMVLYQQLATQIRGMEREFGLTPAARVGLEVKPEKSETDTAKQFLFGKRG